MGVGSIGEKMILGVCKLRDWFYEKQSFLLHANLNYITGKGNKSRSSLDNKVRHLVLYEKI